MDKSWFDYLGKYDTDMDIWGGENFGESLSLRPGAGGTCVLGPHAPGMGAWDRGSKSLLGGKARWGTRGVFAGTLEVIRHFSMGKASPGKTVRL